MAWSKETKTMAAISLVAILAAPSPSALGATKPTPPKVGDCYLIPQNEINAAFSKAVTVNCGKGHNAETWKVGKWSGPSDPATLSEVERRGIADQICQPDSVLNDFFNTWSYKVPTSKQWSSGLRIIRCDALTSMSDSITVSFKSWKGKKLQLK